MQLKNRSRQQARRQRRIRALPRASHAGTVLLTTALQMLPGLVRAEAPPDQGVMSARYLGYQDSQPGENRIHVSASTLGVMAPIAGEWSIASNFTTDSISGASPRYYTYDYSGRYPVMHDLRRAEDVALTRYFSQGTVTMGTSYSKESDYISKGLSTQGTLSTESHNTTLNAGFAVSNDEINPVNHIVSNERKHVADLLLGVTQILTPNDIAQVELGRSLGQGYFSDPYKIFDNRPRQRDHTTFLVRWNHFYDATQGVSHLSWRYYADTYGIHAHTVDGEYVQPLGGGWSLAPELRFYSQSHAWFYLEPAPGSQPYPTFPPPGTAYSSLDQRLSSFGAITVGLRVSRVIKRDWIADIKYEQYEQRTGWSVMGNSSPLDPFRARSVQLGLARLF
ncbi:MAG: DUF3570 domain-containing protein [Betaproteobacteria bacterium]|nr:DUF3570 domain-containing protein [Betaproteobacteria bacterium]MDE2623108.1 DUF3570 domain-containing protein [Betaproteobacteria bacterium]